MLSPIALQGCFSFNATETCWARPGVPQMGKRDAAPQWQREVRGALY